MKGQAGTRKSGWVITLADKLLPATALAGGRESLWRARLIVLLTLALSGLGLGGFAELFMRGRLVPIVVCGTAIAVGPLLLLLFRITGNAKLVGNLILVNLTGAISVLTWYGGGLGAPVLYLLPVVPVFAYSIRGHRSGLLWFGICAVALLLGVIVQAAGATPPTVDAAALQRSHAILVATLLVTLVLSAMAYEIRKNAALDEARAAHRKAEAQNQTKSDFITNVSHEIRTPMGGILGAASLLSARPLPTDDQELVQVINDSCQSLLSLVDDLLDLSRIEARLTTLTESPFDVRDVLDAVHRLVEPLALSKALTLRSHIDPPRPPLVVGDVGRFRQVLLNLVTNAIKFTEEGQVQMRARLQRRPGGSVRLHLAVQDTGVGIAPEDQARVFGRHVQVGDDDRPEKGAGLGLTISQELVTLQGGTIRVESTPGRGTTFHVQLDLPEAPARTATESPTLDTARLKGCQVLVAEDDSANRLVVEKLLAHLGCDTTTVTDGEQAVALVADRAFDLVLMDCHMPKLDGYAATHAIRNLDRGRAETPIVALTAAADPASEARCFDCGMDAVLTKPVDKNRLADIVLQWATSPAHAMEEPAHTDRRLASASTLPSWPGSDDLGLWFDELVEKAGIAIAVDDDAGKLVYSNQRFADLFGYSESEIQSLGHLALVHPEDIPLVRQHHEQRVQGAGAPQRYGFRGLRKNGTVVHLEVETVTLRTGERIAGTRNYFWDVSERKRLDTERELLNTRLLRAEKWRSLGVLAGGVAHRFNNLLTSVMGNAEYALLRNPDNVDVKESLEQLYASAKEAAQISLQMLALSGRRVKKVEWLDLAELVQDMQGLLRVQLGKNMELKLDLGTDVPKLRFDANELSRILVNLVTNAAEALADGPGQIVVTTSLRTCDRRLLRSTYVDDALESGRYVYLEVSDDGPGMDEETSARMFEPFFTTKHAGYGLGLAAALGIIRSHRGAVTVKSRPGEGTSIGVLLPIKPAPQPGQSPQPEKSPLPTQSRRLLLADDNEAVRRVAEKMLEHLGFEVDTAGDGQEAVDRFREGAAKYCAVLLDARMPVLDGFEALDAIRAIRSDIPVLLTTGLQRSTALEEATAKPGVRLLKKPFNVDRLQEALAQLLPEAADPAEPVPLASNPPLSPN